MKKELLHQKRDKKGHYTKASHVEKPKIKVAKIVLPVKSKLDDQLVIKTFLALLQGSIKNEKSIQYLGAAIWTLVLMDFFIVFWIVNIFTQLN